MSLDRKDIRAKLDADKHALLTAIAEADALDIGELVERVIEAMIWQRVHAATVIADAAQRLGIAGNRRESPGKPGNRREPRP